MSELENKTWASIVITDPAAYCGRCGYNMGTKVPDECPQCKRKIVSIQEFARSKEDLNKYF